MIFKEFLSIGLSNIAARISTLLVLPILSKNFDLENIGLYDSLWTLMILLELVFCMKIPDAMFRYGAASADNTRKLIFNTSCKILAVSVVVLNVSAFFLYYKFGGLTIIIAALVTTRIFIFVGQEYMRLLKKFAVYRNLNVAIGIGLIFNVLFLTFYKVNFTVEDVYAGYILIHLVSLAFTVFTIAQNGNAEMYTNLRYVTRINFRDILKYGAMLMPSAVAWWAMRMASRWVAVFYIGLEAAGIVTISLYPFVILTAVSTYMVLSFQRPLFKMLDSKIYAPEVELYDGYSRVAVFSSGYFLTVFFSFTKNIGWSFFLEANTNIVLMAMISGVYLSMAAFYGVVYSALLRVGRASINSVVSAAFSILVMIISVNSMGIISVGLGMMSGALALFIVRRLDYLVIRYRMSVKKELLFFGLVAIGYYLAIKMPVVSIFVFIVIFNILAWVFCKDFFKESLDKLKGVF